MDRVSLLEFEPELAAGLSGRQREIAEQGLQVPVIRLPKGPWDSPLRGQAGGLGYLLFTGMLMRRVTVASGCSVELLASGDCLLPWREERASFTRAEWRVVDNSRLAVLDLRPGSPLSRWPLIAAAIAGRAIDRARALALQSAIMSIVGIEERLKAMLWALAERWGRLVPGGAEIELHVPQSVLAEMVGARRPTVSQALASLCDRGLLESPEPGLWLLRDEPPAVGPKPRR